MTTFKNQFTEPTPDSGKHHSSTRNWMIWWRLLRPHTLTASFIPVGIGSIVAMNSHAIDFRLFLAMLFACMIIQAATNMFNEYYDYIRGLDHIESVGIGGTIVRDKIPPRTVLILAISLFIVAIFLGIFICMSTSWWIAVIGAVSMAAGYFYTGGPLPIAYTPFGEVVAGFFMGTVIIGISYYIQTNSIDVLPIILSIPFALLIGAILLANNIRDLEGDKLHGRKTIAIYLGHDKAVYFLMFLLFAPHVLVVSLVLLQIISYWSLITLLSIPMGILAIRGFKGKSLPIEMMPAMKSTAQMTTQFGLLFMIGFIIENIIR
jgi:1,4-dihydroxy-2-naphthoate octaprenyltransferase